MELFLHKAGSGFLLVRVYNGGRAHDGGRALVSSMVVR
jgi:hypothetical protein